MATQRDQSPVSIPCSSHLSGPNATQRAHPIAGFKSQGAYKAHRVSDQVKHPGPGARKWPSGTYRAPIPRGARVSDAAAAAVDHGGEGIGHRLALARDGVRIGSENRLGLVAQARSDERHRRVGGQQ